MPDLIANLEKLEGPCPEMDALIAARFHAKLIRVTWPAWCVDPPFTASLDAAIALVERELTGAYRATTGPRKYLNIPTPVPARFRAEIIADKCTGVGWHDVEPIALIIALLRAKEAQDG